MTNSAAATGRFDRVVVAMDFDEPSKRALELGLEFVDQFGVELTIVHVWDVPPYPYTSMAGSALRRSVEAGALEDFDAVLAEAKARAPAVRGISSRGLYGARFSRPPNRLTLTFSSSAPIVVRASYAPRWAAWQRRSSGCRRYPS